MNIAEGKGPKQQKKTFPLGQFVTNYGNDGTPGSVYPPAVAYGQQFVTGSGVGYMTASGNIGYAQVGSLNPGLNLNVNGNGVFDISIICSPDPLTALTDVESITAVLNAEISWSGTATVKLQGTYDRYTPNAYFTSASGLYTSTNWVTLGTATITGANNPTLITIATSGNNFYPAYRLAASGANASGIIDWVLPGLFADLSAAGIGQEATWANGNIGQQNIANSNNISISGGLVTNDKTIVTPNTSVDNNHNYFG
jgi:hypothetical protein